VKVTGSTPVGCRMIKLLKYKNMSKQYWDNKLNDYAKEDWALKPSIFAELAKDYFPKEGKILELTAGYGQDGRYFSELGYDVVQTDFSDTGVRYLEENKNENIEVKKVDLKEPLDFEDERLDVVYCHLGIHYFTLKQTTEIVEEIKRVLKPNVVVALSQIQLPILKLKKVKS
jgi:SAM-dependent methyltransferase